MAVWWMASTRLREAILKVYQSRVEVKEEVQKEEDELAVMMGEITDVITLGELKSCRLEILRAEKEKEVCAIDV